MRNQAAKGSLAQGLWASYPPLVNAFTGGLIGDIDKKKKIKNQADWDSCNNRNNRHQQNQRCLKDLFSGQFHRNMSALGTEITKMCSTQQPLPKVYLQSAQMRHVEAVGEPCEDWRCVPLYRIGTPICPRIRE